MTQTTTQQSARVRKRDLRTGARADVVRLGRLKPVERSENVVEQVGHIFDAD